MEFVEVEFAVIFEIIESWIEIDVDCWRCGDFIWDDSVDCASARYFVPSYEIKTEQNEEDNKGNKDVIVHLIKYIYDTILESDTLMHLIIWKVISVLIFFMIIFVIFKFLNYAVAKYSEYSLHHIIGISK